MLLESSPRSMHLLNSSEVKGDESTYMSFTSHVGLDSARTFYSEQS